MSLPPVFPPKYTCPDYLSEMFVDKHGQLQFTARSDVARRQLFEKMYAYKAPIPELTDEFDVNLDPIAPMLYFGFMVTDDELIDYAVKNKLVNPSSYTAKNPFDIWECILPVRHRLMELTEATLYIRPPFSLDPGKWVVTLYSNYTIGQERYVEQDEKEILDIIRQQFGFEGPPMWYWEAGDQ